MQNFLASIPEFQDETRRIGLFSNLPPERDLSRSRWDDKMTFWKRTLERAFELGLIQQCSSSGFFSTSFTFQDDKRTISELFSISGLTPKCLPRIWEEIVKDGALAPVSSITDYRGTPSTWTGYAFSVANFALLSIGNLVFGSNNSTISNALHAEYANVFLLRKIADKFMRIYQNGAYYTDFLLSSEELKLKLKQQVKDFNITDQDVLLFAKYLEISGVASTKMDTKTKQLCLKFNRSRNEKSEISDADEGILNLRRTMKLIETQISELNSKSEDLTSRAKGFIAKKQTLLAKNCLKSRKALMHLLQQRTNSHFQLETIYLRLQHVETETEILSAYESGTVSLSSLMKSNGLNIDRVDETMSALQEALADHDEINVAIKKFGEEITAEVGIDDVDIEGELEKLLEAETSASQQLLQDLPSVPQTLPTRENMESAEIAEKSDNIQSRYALINS